GVRDSPPGELDLRDMDPGEAADREGWRDGWLGGEEHPGSLEWGDEAARRRWEAAQDLHFAGEEERARWRDGLESWVGRLGRGAALGRAGAGLACPGGDVGQPGIRPGPASAGRGVDG